MSDLLRILTCIELFINPLYYAKHEIFKKAFDGNMFASLNSVFIQSIANNVLSDETSLSNDDYVKKTAIKLIERHVDAPFISVLGLASVVESPIKLCTKDIVDARQMKFYNCHIDPRESVERGNTVFLFWTLSNDTSENKLNHFVPLINSKSLVSKFIKRTNFVRKESTITKPLIESVFFKIGTKRTMKDSTKSNDIKRSKVVSSLTKTSESICSKKMNFYFKPKCNKNASPIPAVQIPLYKQLPCDDEPDSSNYNSSSETNNNISQLVSNHKYPVVCDDNAEPSYKQLPCDDELHFSNFISSSETNSSNFNSSETNTNISQLISIHKYPVVCDDKKAESNKYTIGEVKGQNTGGALANNVNNSAGCSQGRSMLSCKSDAFDIGNHINCKRSASETSALLDKKFGNKRNIINFLKISITVVFS